LMRRRRIDLFVNFHTESWESWKGASEFRNKISP